MLVQDPQHPELWVNPAWTGGEPGTFAVIIGVSAYAHLTGRADTYELGQLHVSALTAYRFFCWLRDSYRHPDKPLARCWLLLAPTEREVEPAMPQTPEPTFEGCRTAIGQWFASMQNLNSVYSEQSRAVFFFSGHGLEVRHDKQILLPSDYLEPPVALVNRALSTYNLYAGLRALPVPEHFFFLDACRNDHEALRVLSLEGTEVLNVHPSYNARPDVKSPIVYATGPGAVAWQPTDPATGASVFGRALVEGLKGERGMQPSCDEQRCWVNFRGLEDFLDPRVTELMMAAGAKVKQPVRIWGPVGKTDICEVPRPAEHLEAPGDALDVAAKYGLYLQERGRAAGMDVVSWPDGWRPSAAAGKEAAHDLLRSETLTELLWNARVYDLHARRWSELKADAEPPPLTCVQLASSAGRHRAYRLDVQLISHGAYWVELEAEWVKQKVACVLPGDEAAPPRYTIEIDVDESPIRGELIITDFDVVLSPDNPERLGQAAALWSEFRAGDIDKAATPEEMQLLERALADKVRSPLAATVAALLLLRAWRHDLLHDWPRNLAEGFPDRPDGCVVWAEQLLRTTNRESPAAVVPWLLRLQERGLPHTAEGLTHAARQVPELLRFAFSDPSVLRAEQREQYDRLTALGKRLRQAMTAFRPGGLCTTFIGRKELVTPALLIS
jgi:hypothetical protein